MTVLGIYKTNYKSKKPKVSKIYGGYKGLKNGLCVLWKGKMLVLVRPINERNKKSSNFGFIGKKKVAREIAKIYKDKSVPRYTREEVLRDWEVQSTLNLLCARLDIKPMHRNKLGGGTGEMCWEEGGTSD